MVTESEQESRWRNHFRSVINDSPKDYLLRCTQLKAMQAVFFQEMEVQLIELLETYINKQPQVTKTNKLALAEAVGETLSSIGLSLRCPRTGRPAKLVVEIADGSPDDFGHFGLEIKDNDGMPLKTISNRKSFPMLGRLELMREDASPLPPLPARLKKKSPPARGR